MRRLRQLAEQARDGRHLFVCGMPRSGTTVLRAHLERQSVFGGRQPPHSPETRLFLQPGVLFAPGTPDGRRAYGYLGDEAAARAFARLVAPWRPVHAVGRRVLRGRAQGRLGFRALAHPTLLRAFFGAAQQAVCSERLVEKTPAHLGVVDRILHTFPEADVVLTVRHPVDCYASHRKRIAEGDPGGWLRMDWEEFAARYRADVAAVRQWRARFPGAVHLVRYEDLVAPDGRRLARLHEELAAPVDAPAPSGRGLPLTARSIRPLRPSWRDHLSGSEVVGLQAGTATAMAALGYEPYV